jgi:membrane-associated phospholipid phosphatase
MHSNRLLAHYAFIDYATQGYLLAIALLVVFFHGKAVADWPLLIAAHGVTITLVHWLIQLHARRQPGWWLDFLRHFYPVLLYAALYRETAALNQMFVTSNLDPFFIRLERRVFGCQPSLKLMTDWPHPVVSELFYAAYFSYYLMIAGVGLALFFRNRNQFLHYVSVMSFLFYVCYLTYIFLPVTGPLIFFKITEHPLPNDIQPAEVPAYPAAVQAGPFYQIMAFIYRLFEAPGAAFPSSHVVVAIGTLYFSFLYLKRIRVLHLVMILLLCVATVYCRYHYALDVAAGIVTAAVFIPTGNWLYSRFRTLGQESTPEATRAPS